MPAPTNISGATAVELGSLPNSITQDVHFAGTTYTVWYKYTHSGNDDVVGIWAFGDLVGYAPILYVSLSVTGTPQYIGIDISNNKPVQFPVSDGVVYYLKVETNSAVITPASLTIAGEFAPDETTPVGSIIINDDTEDFPAAVISGTDGDILAFKQPVVAGEKGAVLPTSGRILYHSGTDLYLYDNNLELITSFAFPQVGGDPTINTNRANTFYISTQGTGLIAPTWQRMDNDGTLFGTQYTFTVGDFVGAMTVNVAETIVYYSQAGGETIVKRWDLTNNVALANFLADVAGYHLAPDMLTLADDTIIIGFQKDDSTDAYIKRYNAAGAVQNTYNFGGSYTVNHLAYAIDANTFWVWLFPEPTNGYIRLVNINASSGAYVQDFNVPLFWVGLWQGPDSESPMPRFGVSGSCTFLVLALAAADITGLYFGDPTATHDTYRDEERKIPNPTIRTALIGE